MLNYLRNAGSAVRSLHRKGAFYVVGGSFLAKLASFMGSVIIVRLLTKYDYGILSSIENIYSYAYMVAGYGLNNAVLRYVVLEENHAGKKGIFLYALKSGTIFNLTLVIVAGALLQFAPIGGSCPQFPILLFVMLAALPFQYAFESSSCALRALFKNKYYAILSLACVLVVWATRIMGAEAGGLVGSVCSWPIAYAALSVFAIVLVLRKFLSVKNASYPDSGLRQKMRVYSLQYMVTNGLWALFLQNDIFLIGFVTGEPAEVASYKVAYTIPAALSILSYSIGVFVGPYFVRHENDREWVWRSYRKILIVVCGVFGVAVLLLSVFAEPLLALLFGCQYADDKGLMCLLLFSSFVNNGVRFTAANLLAAMGRIRVNMLAAAGGLVIQVVLDLSLIPLLGAIGAAYSSIASYLFMAIIVTVYFVKCFCCGRREG